MSNNNKGNKRISVFDRLGPGNDESAAGHRRYSSEKHSSSSSTASQEKVRGHPYGPSVPSTHLRIDDRETPPTRDRKTRHRGSMGEYPTSIADGETAEDKRSSNPPPMKSPRDPPEGMKSVGVKVVKPPVPGTIGSGDSDIESGEEGKRRKPYRSDHDVTGRRGKHGSDDPEDEASRRSSRVKEKGHGHSERGGSHLRSPPPPPDIPGKPRSRREGVAISHDHKRRKEEEPKTPSELGQKRKRDHLEDPHLPEGKRARHGDHHANSGRDADRHHGNTAADHPYSSLERKWRPESSGHEIPSRRQHRSSSPRTPVTGEKGRAKSHKHSRDANRKTAPSAAQEKSHSRVSEVANRTRMLDWVAVGNFTEKANSKISYHSPKSVLEKFTPAALFASVEVSPSLAGPERYQRIRELASAQAKESEESNFNEYTMEGSEGIVTQNSEPDWDKAISGSLGACRRALTASDDYVLRRNLRKDQNRSFMGPVRATPNNWATEHYEIALEFYHALPTKPSGKAAHRLQPSKVGTLVL